MRFSFVSLVSVLFLTGNSIAAQDLEIVNLRVGQGDATLILGPPDSGGERVAVLFDAGDMSPGKFDGGHIMRTVLKRRGIDELDFMIVSHDDADHIGGLAYGASHGSSFMLGFDDLPGFAGDDDGNGIVDWVKEGPIWEPDPAELGTGNDINVKMFVDYGSEMRGDTQAIKKYLAFANAKGNRIEINDQAEVDGFEIDLGNGAKMTCYAGNGYVRGGTSRVSNVDSPNEKSLSFLVTYGEFDFLISGDLIGRRTNATENAKVEEAVGAAIVRDGRTVEVLHVNHHGADNASSKAFLELIRPHIAVISAGNFNTHKHPKNAVLQRLVDAGVYRIIQTAWGTTKDKIPLDVRDNHAIWQQDIIVRSDGEDYWIETSRKFASDERIE